MKRSINNQPEKSYKRLKLEKEIFSQSIKDIKLMFNDEFNEINNESWFINSLKKPNSSSKDQIHNNSNNSNNKTGTTTQRKNSLGDTTIHSDPSLTSSRSNTVDKHITPQNPHKKLNYDCINLAFLDDEVLTDTSTTPKVVLKSSTPRSLINFDLYEDIDLPKINLENDLKLIDKMIVNNF